MYNYKNTLSMNLIIEPLVRSCTIDIESVQNVFKNQPIMGAHFAKHQWNEDINIRRKKERLINVLNIDLNVYDDDCKFNEEIQKWNDSHINSCDQISLIDRKYTDETYNAITGFCIEETPLLNIDYESENIDIDSIVKID